jgi:hypothetical protein
VQPARALRAALSATLTATLSAALIATTTAARAADGPADVDSPAPPRPDDPKLALFAGAGYLGSPGADGGALLAGLRLGVGRHFAASFDVGYGLLAAPGVEEDRWWVMPAAAWVIPAGPVRFDLGAGGGVGTSSGYVTWSDYVARPFTPAWHFTVPAVRAHATAAVEIARGLDVFARVDVASLLFVGSQSGATDTTWVALWVGVEPRLL